MKPTIEQDARRSLPQLLQEWGNCTACELGVQALSRRVNHVPGIGTTGHLMVIGDSPSSYDEKMGRHFAGSKRGTTAGEFLVSILKKLELDARTWFTTVVMCRSCRPALNDDGSVKLSKTFNSAMEPYYLDNEPPDPYVLACYARLMQEIYLVDPLLIVTVGNAAAKLMRGMGANLAGDGELFHVGIPGAGRVPKVTPKKLEWVRYTKKQVHIPTAQNKVQYLTMVGPDLNYAHRTRHDERDGTAPRKLIRTLAQAAQVLRRYDNEVLKRDPMPELANEETLWEATRGE